MSDEKDDLTPTQRECMNKVHEMLGEHFEAHLVLVEAEVLPENGNGTETVLQCCLAGCVSRAVGMATRFIFNWAPRRNT